MEISCKHIISQDASEHCLTRKPWLVSIKIANTTVTISANRGDAADQPYN